MMIENPVSRPVNTLSLQRWSPYAYDADRGVDRADLESLFEAARWAMSSFNAQPWRYVVGVRERDPETWGRVFETLLEGNRGWAQHAPVLALGLAQQRFERNGKPNRHAAHDLGAASASLSYEAAARGLAVHQMGGFSGDRARELFDLPEDLEPFTALAIGYPAPPGSTDPQWHERDARGRERKPLGELVIRGGL